MDEDFPAVLEQMLESAPVVLFKYNDESFSNMAEVLLSNLLAPALLGQFDLANPSSPDLTKLVPAAQLPGLRSYLATKLRRIGSGPPPYVFVEGKFYGSIQTIVTDCQSGNFQHELLAKGIPTLPFDKACSDSYGYPKGLPANFVRNGRKNIVLCGCGSSASDKIPQLVKALVEAQYNVKVVVTEASLFFWKDFGTQEVLKYISHMDLYRNDDEWTFSYADFGMSVRATHLALRVWADAVIVAPITCNSMAKICAGIGDTLVTEMFVAWEWHTKPVILCPAMNTDMYYNPVTQRNMGALREYGAHLLGPRVSILSNGKKGIGAMWEVHKILTELNRLMGDTDHMLAWVCNYARWAAASHDSHRWQRVFQVLDDPKCDLGIDLTSSDGDTLLHYAAGGEGDVDGLQLGVAKVSLPDLKVMAELIKRGAKADVKNNYGATPLHVAVANDSLPAAKMLLDHGASVSLLPSEAIGNVSNIQLRLLLQSRLNGKRVQNELLQQLQAPTVKNQMQNELMQRAARRADAAKKSNKQSQSI